MTNLIKTDQLEATPADAVFVYRETASGLRLLDSGSRDGILSGYAHNHSRGQVQEVKAALSAGYALGIRWDGNVTVFSPYPLTPYGEDDVIRMADEDERASAHQMAGYTSTTCGEY